MASQHTPGPWAQVTYGASSYEIQGAGRNIAVVSGVAERSYAHAAERNAVAKQRGQQLPHPGLQPPDRGESLANAQLIAAAPALLAALAAIVERSGGRLYDTDQDTGETFDAMARAALAQAKGG